jgi:hypothetical protein
MVRLVMLHDAIAALLVDPLERRGRRTLERHRTETDAISWIATPERSHEPW